MDMGVSYYVYAGVALESHPTILYDIEYIYKVNNLNQTCMICCVCQKSQR